MNEEELYRLATEELNGPNRRADLWKRAVALATDDHDEARYLYTNLRVEELLQERELAGGTLQFSASDMPVEETPSVDNIDFDNPGFDNPDAVAQDPTSINTPEPELSEAAINDQDLGLDQLADELAQDREPQISTAESIQQLIGDVPESMRAARRQQNPGLNELLIEGDEDQTIQLGADEYDQAATSDVTSPAMRAGGIAGGSPDPADDIFDPEAEDFLQATSALPDALEDAVDHEADNPEIDLDARANQTQDITRYLDDTLDNSLSSLDTLGTTAGIGATAKTIIGEGRKRFDILAHADGRSIAVKHGVSWPALFFTMPWLLVKKLWGTLLIYIIMLAVLLVGGLALALHVDVAPAWTNPLRLVTVGFSALAFTGVVLIPFIRGNHWVSRRLQRKGFESHGIIKANSPEHALEQLAR